MFKKLDSKRVYELVRGSQVGFHLSFIKHESLWSSPYCPMLLPIFMKENKVSRKYFVNQLIYLLFNYCFKHNT